jgi:hypothetical protein
LKRERKSINKRLIYPKRRESHFLRFLFGGTESLKVLKPQFVVKDLISLQRKSNGLPSPKLSQKVPKTMFKIVINKFQCFVLTIDSSKKIFMTATEWENSNPTGWWMTEKFDGMRLFWDGSQFFTRQGNKVKAPEFITKEMPNIALDGELW